MAAVGDGVAGLSADECFRRSACLDRLLSLERATQLLRSTYSIADKQRILQVVAAMNGALAHPKEHRWLTTKTNDWNPEGHPIVSLVFESPIHSAVKAFEAEFIHVPQEPLVVDEDSKSADDNYNAACVLALHVSGNTKDLTKASQEHLLLIEQYYKARYEVLRTRWAQEVAAESTLPTDKLLVSDDNIQQMLESIFSNLPAESSLRSAVEEAKPFFEKAYQDRTSDIPDHRRRVQKETVNKLLKAVQSHLEKKAPRTDDLSVWRANRLRECKALAPLFCYWTEQVEGRVTYSDIILLLGTPQKLFWAGGPAQYFETNSAINFSQPLGVFHRCLAEAQYWVLTEKVNADGNITGALAKNTPQAPAEGKLEQPVRKPSAAALPEQASATGTEISAVAPDNIAGVLAESDSQTTNDANGAGTVLGEAFRPKPEEAAINTRVGMGEVAAAFAQWAREQHVWMCADADIKAIEMQSR